MSKQTRSNILHTLTTLPQRIIRYLSGPITRIFGPTDDDYPATGTQPFDGEPPHKKSF